MTLNSPTSMAILPGDPPQLCPELLTEEEAIRYLRLDTVRIDDAGATLRRYRSDGSRIMMEPRRASYPITACKWALPGSVVVSVNGIPASITVRVLSSVTVNSRCT